MSYQGSPVAARIRWSGVLPPNRGATSHRVHMLGRYGPIYFRIEWKTCSGIDYRDIEVAVDLARDSTNSAMYLRSLYYTFIGSVFETEAAQALCEAWIDDFTQRMVSGE